MKTTTTKELRTNLAAIRRQVMAGETIEVIYRSRPVMRLTPIRASQQGNGTAVAKVLRQLEPALRAHTPQLDPSEDWDELYRQTLLGKSQ